MTCGIYMIQHKDTGQSYIGLSENIERRWYEHTHNPNLKNSRIDPAIRKHGVDKFRLEIIEELPNDRILLMKREEHWIAYYNTYEDDFHYNLTPGGEGFKGDTHPSWGNSVIEDFGGLDYIKECNKKGMTQQEVANNIGISKRNLAYYLSRRGYKWILNDRSGENSPSYGKKHTLQTKNNIAKKISQLNNTTGYFRVDKQPCKACTNGYIYRYRYHDNDGQHKAIRSVDIEKLQQKVQDKGLEWIKWGDDNNG